MSWLTRLWKLLRSALGDEPEDLAVDDSRGGPATSSITLVPGSLRLRVGVVSTVGNHREHNEDNFYVPGRKSIVEGGSTEKTGEIATTTLDSSNLFIVADGMGGQQAGEEASRMAIDLIPKALSQRLAGDDADARTIQVAIREAVAEANKEILGSSGAVTEYANMGTTVVLALFRHDRVYVAGIGDSRAYRLRDRRLEQLTKDHSLADALGEAGTISKEDVANHKFKNILYLYLGSKDARSGPEEIRNLDVLPGDRFLMASDGLTGVVPDADLTRVLESCEDPQSAAEALKKLALANDSKDNVTCLVIHVVAEEDPFSTVASG